jgi:hypothetical protein
MVGAMYYKTQRVEPVITANEKYSETLISRPYNRYWVEVEWYSGGEGCVCQRAVPYISTTSSTHPSFILRAKTVFLT